MIDRQTFAARTWTLLSSARVAFMALTAAFAAHAQDIEPHQYSSTPVDENFLVSGYAYTRGGVAVQVGRGALSGLTATAKIRDHRKPLIKISLKSEILAPWLHDPLARLPTRSSRHSAIPRA